MNKSEISCNSNTDGSYARDCIQWSGKITLLRGICLRYRLDGSVLAHSCVQGASSGKGKSNNRYKQIREVCSKHTIQEAGETRGTSLQGRKRLRKEQKLVPEHHQLSS